LTLLETFALAKACRSRTIAGPGKTISGIAEISALGYN